MRVSTQVHRQTSLVLLMVALMLLSACGGDEAISSTRAAPRPAPTAVDAPSGVGDGGEALSLEVVESAELMLITDHRGFAVYGNERDTADSLFCADTECTSVWQPLAPRDRAVSTSLDLEKYEVISRPDGLEQVVYDGVPLYLWSGESVIGVPRGSGIAGIWFALTADGRRVQ